ncbi:hypothetical protein AKJ08_0959 [Vulgatibacter incomptus]|uniref:Cep192/Spd-2-like domain-containing protein n=1 Tax=Vulgatibacter incomptus TaxID=1391653 RepID=A0A0K1PAP2_9BACT|nr:hypothetical protein AKJ08_0959 [Vulgatibacter incomptus]
MTFSNTTGALAEVRVTGSPVGYEVRPSILNVEPGSRFDVEIAFLPAREARFDGVITFSVDDGTDRAEIGIDVRGEGIQRVVEVVEALDFGFVAVGETRTLPLTISSIVEKAITLAVSIEGGADAFVSGSGVVELAGGETRTIDVSFSPSNRGAHTASLRFRSCESCQAVSVRLTGSGGFAHLRSRPPAVTVGTVRPGSSRSATFGIENAGDFPATVSSVTLVGDPERDPTGGLAVPREFSLTGVVVPFEVAPTAIFPMEVVFHAAAQSEPRRYAKVRVMGPNDEVLVEVPVDGRSGGIEVIADPVVVDFGRQPKNFAAKKIFVLQNVGDPVSIQLFPPEEDSNYTVVAADGSPPPWTLGDGPMGVEVTFEGSESQDYPAELVFPIYVNGALSGEQPFLKVEAIATVVDFPPCELDVAQTLRFGAVKVGTSVTLPIDITNRGTSECLVWGLELDPDGSRAFSSTSMPSHSTAVLAPGEKLTVAVRYAPTRTMGVVDSSHLVFNHSNVDTPPTVVPISGLAMGLDLVAEPNPILFGPVPTPLQAFKPFVVRNRGAEAVRITRISIAADGSQRFSARADDQLPLAIAPAASKGFTASYKPLEWTIDHGTIELWLEGIDEPFLVRAKGTAVDDPCELCSWPTAICPAEAQSVMVNSRAVLAGDADSPFGREITCKWQVISAPIGSSARPQGAGCTPSFVPDLVGRYVFELLVTDALGNKGACQHQLTSRPMDAITVETFWDVAGDVDLHLLNEDLGDRRDPNSWFSDPADCYFANCTDGRRPSPLWEGSRAKTAILEENITLGTGPEIIHIEDPSETHSYAIGIHNVSVGGRPVTVTTNVYCARGLAQSVTTEFTESKQFAVIGSIRFGSSTCSFTPDDTVWNGFH